MPYREAFSPPVRWSDKRRRIAWQFVAFALLGLSCQTGGPVPGEDHGLSSYEDITTAAEYLDVVAKGVDEYGTVSVSAAAVVRRPRNFIGFRLDLTPKQIFEANKTNVQAASRSYDALSINARIAAAIRLLKDANATDDPVEAANLQGQAEGVMTSAVIDAATKTEGGEAPEGTGGEAADESGGGEDSGTDDGSEGGDAGETKDEDENKDADAAREALGLPTENTAASALQNAHFSTGYDARTPDTLNLPLRQLIKMAFDDHTTLKLFEWLSEPEAYGMSDQKVLFAAVLNVNLRPGRRTYEGYKGEVDVRVGYAKSQPGKPPKQSRGDYPLAFAVFPALDSQVQDQRSSIRRQIASSMLLTALFPKGDVTAQLDTIRRLEQDVATLTTRNTVTGYNMNGRHFGWHFSPQLHAQDDPSDIGSRPGMMLQPESFPAVVLILADKSQLPPSCTDRESAAAVEACKVEIMDTGDPLPSSGTRARTYDHFVFHTTTRWMREGDPHADRSWLPFARERNAARHPRLDEVQLADWAWRIEAAAKMSARHCSAAWSAWHELCQRVEMFHALGLGVDSFQEIPNAKPDPILAAEFKDGTKQFHGWQNQPTAIAISGRHFRGQVFEAVVGTRTCKTVVPSDELVVVSCDPLRAKNHSTDPFTIQLMTTAGVLKAGKITFNLVADATAAKIEPFARLESTFAVAEGGALAFGYDEKPPPASHGGWVLLLRPAGDAAADFVEVDAPIVQDAKAKKLLAKFPKNLLAGAATPAWMKQPARLEVDLRLKSTPDDSVAKAISVLISKPPQKPTIVFFPSADSRKLTLETTALTFEKDGTTKSPLYLAFKGDLSEIYPGLEKVQNLKLILGRAEHDNVEIPIAVDGKRLKVEVSALAPLGQLAPETPTTVSFDRIDLSEKRFSGPIEIKGALTITKKK